MCDCAHALSPHSLAAVSVPLNHTPYALVLSQVKQQFEFHSGPVLDVAWRDNSLFASSSSDKTIHVCQLGDNKPIRTYTGHTVGDVTLLAGIKVGLCGFVS